VGCGFRRDINKSQPRGLPPLKWQQTCLRIQLKISQAWKGQGRKPAIRNRLIGELRLRPTNKRILFLWISSPKNLTALYEARVVMFPGEVIRLLVRGEASLLDVAAIVSRCARDHFSHVRIPPREFRLVSET
jgi:hypothetical protein